MTRSYRKRKKPKALYEEVEKLINYSQTGASHRKNAFKGMPDLINSPDEDIGESKETLMARSRYLFMGNPIAVGAIKKIRTNVVGKGLRLKSTIDNEFLQLPQEKLEQIQKKIEFLWKTWAESTECDLMRKSNFYEIQSLAMLNMLMDGETFVLLPFRQRKGEIFELKIQLVDSSRCVNPNEGDYKNVKNGVEVDDDGTPIAYHFRSEDKEKVIRVEAFGKKTGRKNVIVVMDKERIAQRRGVPLLAPVIEDLHQITKFTEAELMNAALSAIFSVFIEYDKEVTRPGSGNPLQGVKYQQDPDGDRNMKLGSGTMIELRPGQKVSFADPGRPNQNFDNFVGAITKYIGTALEIPYEVLISSFHSSYSASRAALLEAWKMYHMRREWFVNQFCQPVFEELMDELVIKRYIDLPGYFDNPFIRRSYLTTEWYGQAQGQLNPIAEVKASVMKIENGLSTYARESRELNGSDFIANHEQLVIENKKRGEVNVLQSGD